MSGAEVSRRRVLIGAGALGVLGTLVGPSGVQARDDRDDRERDGTRVRWDIVNIDFAAGCVSAGGEASARAEDGSRITITGSGTFEPGEPEEVTGGGTWRTAGGAVGSASGTYRVTRLVSWDRAPGTLPLPCDNIGRAQNASAGLVKLRVRYSNGKRGVLTVSCHLMGTPDSVFEGITASMGFVEFWNHEVPPPPPANGNRTLFHVRRDND